MLPTTWNMKKKSILYSDAYYLGFLSIPVMSVEVYIISDHPSEFWAFSRAIMAAGTLSKWLS